MKKKNLILLFAMMMAATFCVGFASCGGSDDDEDDGVDTTPISLVAGKDKTIQGADTITTSNKFVAYATKNVVYASHVGEAALVVNGKKTIPIKVLPAYHLYDDPVCKWGCDVNYVKNNQKQGTISSKSTSEMVVYEDAGAASFLIYRFKNSKLESVAALVSTNHTSQYASYLAERYLMLPYYQGKDTYFIGADNIDLESASTVVMMEVYNVEYLMTAYMPAKDYSSRSNRSVGNGDDLREIAKSLMSE